MAEDSKTRAKEARSHEIQSSIAQGNMMLNVLRSLPASENVQAFIVRFEELVARLQKCESQCTQNTACQPEMDKQFEILRQKQEKMKSLLEQTTKELKSTLADSIDFPGTSQPATENDTLLSATECLSQLQAQLTSEAETFETLIPSPIASNDSVVPVSSPQAQSRVAHTSALSEHVADAGIPAGSHAITSTPHTTPVARWSNRLAVPVAQLDDLIEDSRKFQSMVERLIDITKRAHLTEATGFLVDIAARFVDLRNSFDSLKRSYEEVRDDSELPSELREIQLTGFQEFLERLGSNLESTKECFFNIYHLVKSDIEHSVADGSLQTVLSDNEEAGEDGDQPDQPDTTQNTTVLRQSPPAPQQQQQQQSDAVPVSVAESATSPPCTPGSKATHSLASQKAYLTALQNQTASERQEIQRLLQQRDQLAERLATLRATTLLADSLVKNDESLTESNDPTAQNDTEKPATRLLTESIENGLPEQVPTESAEDLPSASLLSSLSLAHQQQSALLSHLEGKRRELHQLRAQLSALRQAEANATAAVAQQTKEDGEADIGDLATGSSGVTMRCINGVAPLDSRLSGRASTACPQPSANTEKLYENMREARILLEQQRDLSASSTDAKALLQRLTGVASVTNSQDRTTLATWGGSSSPVHSSTSTVSGADEDDADDVDEPVVQSRSAQQAQLTTVSTGSSSLLGFSPTGAPAEVSDSGAPVACRGTVSHHHQHRKQPHTVISDGDMSGSQQMAGTPQMANLVALPQLGHSPSPPPSRQKQTQCDVQLGSDSTDLHSGAGGQYVYPHPLPTKSTVMAGGDVPISELSYGLINERMQRMEMNIAQLFQVCRCLAVENSSLRSIVSQLLSTPTSNISNDLLVANQSAPNSGMMTPIGGMRAAPDAAPGSVLLVSPHHRQQMQHPVMFQHTGYAVASSQQPSAMAPGGGSLLTPRLAESAGSQAILLHHQQQQQLQLQQQRQQDLEAQQQQLLSRLLLQQQQQSPQVPVLPMDRLPRRPLLFPSAGHLASADMQWLAGSLGQPATASSAVSGDRLSARAMTNGYVGGQYGPSAGVAAPDPAYNCLLSPQSSMFPGQQSIPGGLVTVGSMLPVGDPAYQMPLLTDTPLPRYSGGIM